MFNKKVYFQKCHALMTKVVRWAIFAATLRQAVQRRVPFAHPDVAENEWDLFAYVNETTAIISSIAMATPSFFFAAECLTVIVCFKRIYLEIWKSDSRQ